MFLASKEHPISLEFISRGAKIQYCAPPFSIELGSLAPFPRRQIVQRDQRSGNVGSFSEPSLGMNFSGIGCTLEAENTVSVIHRFWSDLVLAICYII